MKAKPKLEPVPVEKLLYTIGDTAYALSVCKRTVRNMIANKTFEGVRMVGNRIRIPASEVRRVSRLSQLLKVA